MLQNFTTYNTPKEKHMKFLMGIIAAVAVMLTNQAFAIDKVNMAAGQALAEKSNCLACHKVEGKLVGPGFKDVSNKYKGDKKAEDMLIAKVTMGGAGVWGTIPMPPNAAVKPTDVKTLVKWVMAN
jgi:cytochrome c